MKKIFAVMAFTVVGSIVYGTLGFVVSEILLLDQHLSMKIGAVIGAAAGAFLAIAHISFGWLDE